jgi:hypothetical protein
MKFMHVGEELRRRKGRHQQKEMRQRKRTHKEKKFILSYDGETDAVVVIERRSSSITVLVHDAAGFI